MRCKQVMNLLKSRLKMKNEIIVPLAGKEVNRALVAKKTENEEKDWVKVLFEVIIKILTLGFYHVEKHRKS